MTQETDNTGHNEFRIVRGRVDSLSLYEITDYELDVLEKGSPASLHLNFGIFLLSMGTSFLSTLISINIGSARIFSVYLVLSVVGILGGIFLLLLWRKGRSEVADVVRKIKKRIAEQDETSVVPNESDAVRATDSR